MLPNPKENHLNPKLIGSLLMLISLFFLIIGGYHVFITSAVYYLFGERTSAVVKEVQRNAWPRFKTFTYTLQYTTANNEHISSKTTLAEVFPEESNVAIVYAPSHPDVVFFDHAYIQTIGYYLGTIALGLFIGLFGLNQFYTIKQPQHLPTGGLEMGQTNTPPSIKVLQKVLMVLLLLCIAGYLVGSSS